MEAGNEEYQYIATSKEMFVKQVVTNYICKGYPLFVKGVIPEGKDLLAFDKKMLDIYGIRMTSQQRWYRKTQSKGNVHYIRFERDYAMFGTERKNGRHLWHDRESGAIKDCRNLPFIYHGYSIYLKGGKYRPRRCKEDPDGPKEKDTKHRSRVLIERETLRQLESTFYKATRRDAGLLASMFWELPFEPYKPVLQQQYKLLNVINSRRKRFGLSVISRNCIRRTFKADKIFT